MGRARLLGLAVLLAIPFGPVAGRAATPSIIVFAADRGPQSTNEIFRLDPDGHRVNLDGGPSENHAPLVSPDGRLAYTTAPYGTTVVVGSNSVPLPFSDVGVLAWSPDGSRLVVAAQTSANTLFDVYTVGTDGSDPVRLTTDYNASAASWR